MKLVMHGLIEKRAETVGRIEALQAQLAQALADLDSLERTIRIFDPAIDLEDARVRPVPPPNAAFRGEVQRFLLTTLRKSGVGMTTHDLARAVMEARGLNTSDKVLFTLIAKRTGHSLKKLRDRGHIASEKATAGGMLRWAFVGGAVSGGWRNGSSESNRA